MAHAVAEASAELDLGRKFVNAIVEHDWDGVGACFAADVRFVAVVPQEQPFREKAGREEAAALIRRWFGDADVTELIESRVTSVSDRIRISYLIQEHEPDGWYLVEQVAYATLHDGLFADVNLACSGFRPIPEPETHA